MDLIATSFLAVLFASLLYWWPKRHLCSLGDKIPGPRGHPIIGSALLFVGEPTKLLSVVMKGFKHYGRVVRVWLGPKLFIGVIDPDDIQVILGDSTIRNRERIFTKAVGTFIGYGLLTLRGDRWKRHRRIILPSFHLKILESFIDVFGKNAKILVKKIEDLEGKSFNVYDILALCTLDNICETAIGIPLNSQTAGNNDFAQCILTCPTFMRDFMIRPWLWVKWIYSRSSLRRQSEPIIKTMFSFSEGVIAEKLSEYRRGVRPPGITTSGNKRVSPFLDTMIAASESQGSTLSLAELRDEVTTIAAAGLDTTATTMSFLLVLIAIHIEVQTEIHRELDEVFGSDDLPATSDDLKQLPVLDRTIRETLRLFPVVPLIPREIDHDVLLPSGFTVPAGSNVVIFPYATHRDERYYTDPLRFWPDRWLAENSKNFHPYAYLPFSAGSRNCLGQKFAQLQMKSILSQVLRCYRVTTTLSMDTLNRLEVSINLSLDHRIQDQFCIQLHKR